MHRLLTCSLFALLLTACGQTGPLYLPQDAPASKPAALAPGETTPAAEAR